MLENETNVQETTEPLTENNNLQQEQETKIVELENKLNKLNQEIKEKEIINIFKKYQVKSEFYDYLKFKTSNIENSKIEDTIKKMIKEQPLFKEPINTGGKPETILTNQPNSIKSSLLDYKKKNNL
ncbi:hypothetical protein [Spiroplasma ixodetis]|uniref:hypothetical protein n=1 Tax=Spiroplasma ixodetis TaxID=2141 RepID=UPI002576DDB9|nr:hypothetical protein [Spiroplasma ixodetis]WJG69824.1 hypothetical protein SIXOD_v1c07940 [Spiroplasma ixodetis Y32]